MWITTTCAMHSSPIAFGKRVLCGYCQLNLAIVVVMTAGGHLW